MIRLSFLMGLFLLFTACSQNDTYQRGYVISKSHLETEAESSSDELQNLSK